jgi:ATP-dependent DNA ligase
MRVMSGANTPTTAVLQEIIKDGGEGLILRRTASRYEQGRSRNLIKLKVTGGKKRRK